MFRQNVALQNADGSHRCWLAPKEIERRLRAGEIRRIIDKGKAPKYRMVAIPEPSNSAPTPLVQITAAEMRQIAQLGERDLRDLARVALAPVTDKSVAYRLKRVQRWMGHGLIPLNDLTAPIAEATIAV
jgi:hypothetical protein